MVGTLLLVQLIPLSSADSLGHRAGRPSTSAGAGRQVEEVNRLGTVLNLVVFSVILVAPFHLLESIKAIEFAGMLALVMATLVIGWLLGGPGSDQRTAMGFSTAVRNVGGGLVIATASFPGTPAVTAGTGLCAVPDDPIGVAARGRWAGSAGEVGAKV